MMGLMSAGYQAGNEGERPKGLGAYLSHIRTVFQPPESMQNTWFAEHIRVPKRIIAASLVINSLGLAMPLVILQIYDRIIPNQSYETLLYLMGGLFAVLVIDTILKIVRSHVSGWSASYLDYVAGVEAVRRSLRASSERVEQDAASTHIDRMNALSATARMFAGPARMGLVDLPFIFIFLGVMAIVSPVITGLLVALFLVFAWMLMKKADDIQQLQDERQNLDRRKYDFVIEVLAGVETIKIMACEPQMMRRYERLQEAIAVAFHRSVLLDGATQSLSAAFAAVTMVTIVSSGAILVIEGTQSIGSLACCLLLGGRAVEVLVRSVRSWSEMSSFNLVKQNVDALLSINPDPELAIRRESLSAGTVSMRNVTLASQMDDASEPYQIDLEVRDGEFIALKGNIPRDDHEFLRLIRARTLPLSGEVLLGGRPLDALVNSSIAGSVAYVPNGPAIFSGTILENLTLFNPREGLHAAREACQLIGLERDIQQLPQGYDMMLGMGGNETLPPSFRQRICIARAIAQKPRILVLEEANALLDQRSDTLLRKGLEKLRGEMTLVFLSNRPSFLSMADRQYILSDGKLCERQDQPPQAASRPTQANAVQQQQGKPQAEVLRMGRSA
ncbi:ATP-binding cassette domain-containing protein [Cohaesibacter sp. CAU 1516]|nr:ATP-binding cassette domain-containing protein [Cohaesibacter sp. CAU 1516]